MCCSFKALADPLSSAYLSPILRRFKFDPFLLHLERASSSGVVPGVQMQMMEVISRGVCLGVEPAVACIGLTRRYTYPAVCCAHLTLHVGNAFLVQSIT